MRPRNPAGTGSQGARWRDVEEPGVDRPPLAAIGQATGLVPARAEPGERVPFTVLSSSSETGRHIVEALCRAGLQLVRPRDLLRSAGDGTVPVALVDTRSEDGVTTLRRILGRQPELAIVALVDGDDIDAHVSALRQGALTAVPVDASAEALLAATFAAAEGRTLLPNEVAIQLSWVEGNHEDVPDLDEVERRILDRLACGDSIRDVAEVLGYSERQTHRKANELYRRLGASNRAQALVRAASQGLVGT